MRELTLQVYGERTARSVRTKTVRWGRYCFITPTAWGWTWGAAWLAQGHMTSKWWEPGFQPWRLGPSWISVSEHTFLWWMCPSPFCALSILLALLFLTEPQRNQRDGRHYVWREIILLESATLEFSSLPTTHLCFSFYFTISIKCLLI